MDSESPKDVVDPTLGSEEMTRFGVEQGARVKGVNLCIFFENTQRIDQDDIYLSRDPWNVDLQELRGWV